MNRVFSVIAVLAMAFLAVAMWLRQTLVDVEGLNSLIVFQVLLGIGILAGSLLLVRTRYVRRKTGITPGRFEAARHVRRLLSAVWS